MSDKQDILDFTREVQDAIDLIGSVNSTEKASVYGDPAETFMVDNADGPDDAVRNINAEQEVEVAITNVRDSGAFRYFVNDPMSGDDAVNIGYLEDRLLHYAKKNGDADNNFKFKPVQDVKSMVSRDKLSEILLDKTIASIGDIIESTTNKLVTGFEHWSATNRVAQIADYPELVNSGSIAVTDIDVTAGTFTFLGYGNTNKLKTSYIEPGSATSPVVVTKSETNGSFWKTRWLKDHGDGVTPRYTDIWRIEVYQGGVLVGALDDGPGDVKNFTGPITGSNGRVYSRGVISGPEYPGAQGYLWDSTWTEIVQPTTRVVNRSQVGGAYWKARIAKYVNGVYIGPVRLIELYINDVMVVRLDPGIDPYLYTTPIVYEGKTYNRGTLVDDKPNGRGYLWDSTWTETVVDPVTVNDKSFLKIRVK